MITLAEVMNKYPNLKIYDGINLLNWPDYCEWCLDAGIEEWDSHLNLEFQEFPLEKGCPIERLLEKKERLENHQPRILLKSLSDDCPDYVLYDTIM